MPESLQRPVPPLRTAVNAIGMTALFGLVVLWVLLLANGYVVNVRTLSIEQRALMSFAGLPAQAQVVVDGQLVSEKLPTVVRNVLPGQHTVRVSAAGYHDWQLSLKVSSGQAIVRDTILLFRTEPIRRALTSDAPVSAIPTVDPTISVSGGEVALLAGNERTLVTRFSQPVLAARLSNDRAHVFLQLGKQLFVTELDGANTTLLVTLDDATPALLMLTDHDSVLTASAGGQVQSWQIR